MKAFVLIATLTAASVATNIYLFVSMPSPAPPEPVTKANTGLQVATKAPTPVFGADCPAHLRLLAVKVADAQHRLDERLSLDDRYERAAPSPEIEQRIRTTLAKLGPNIQVTCHGSTCRFEFPPEMTDWMERIQSPEMRAYFGSMQFSTHLIAQVQDEATVAGKLLAMELGGKVYESNELSACKVQHPTPGYLGVRYDVANGRLAFTETGPLAGSPFAACTRIALDHIAATITVPATASVPEAWRVIEIDVP